MVELFLKAIENGRVRRLGIVDLWRIAEVVKVASADQTITP